MAEGDNCPENGDEYPLGRGGNGALLFRFCAHAVVAASLRGTQNRLRRFRVTPLQFPTHVLAANGGNVRLQAFE